MSPIDYKVLLTNISKNKKKLLAEISKKTGGILHELFSITQNKEYHKFVDLLEIADFVYYQDFEGKNQQKLKLLNKIYESSKIILDKIAIKNKKTCKELLQDLSLIGDDKTKELFRQSYLLNRNLSIAFNHSQNQNEEPCKIKLNSNNQSLFNSFIYKISENKLSLNKHYFLALNNLKKYPEIIVFGNNCLAIASINLIDYSTDILDLKIFSDIKFEQLCAGFEHKSLDEKLEVIKSIAKQNSQDIFDRLSLNDIQIELDFSEYQLTALDENTEDSDKNLQIYYKYYMLKFLKEGYVCDLQKDGNTVQHKAFAVVDAQLQIANQKILKFDNQLESIKVKKNQGIFSWLWPFGWGSSETKYTQESYANSTTQKLAKN
tara:strand:+ start:3824 stop:4951 length:1128 start_codon:yes stop_codon:yes gene_type:complete